MERDFRAELEEREALQEEAGRRGTDAVGQLTAGDDDTDAGLRFVPKALDADDSDSDDASGSEDDSDDDEDDTGAPSPSSRESRRIEPRKQRDAMQRRVRRRSWNRLGSLRPVTRC